MARTCFRFARADWEIEQIHRLNYAAFVEEIPQHAPNPDRRLVDAFHAENQYAIGVLVDDDRCDSTQDAAPGTIVAMLALRDRRPFSLDRKLPNLDTYLPAHTSMCEIRLLYIVPGHRHGKVLRGLMELVAEYAMTRGHDLALISGTTRQLRLYGHLGFVPFGPLVGTGEARFQPMYLSLAAARAHTPWVERLQAEDGGGSAPAPPARLPSPRTPAANFLPGPVNIPAAVQAALAQTPVSHRSAAFIADFAATQRELCRRVGADSVTMMTGSGTLANEAIAAQLRSLRGRGMVAVNGEFGRRLVVQALRWQLDFDRFELPWGTALDYADIEARLAQDPGIGWLWCVHCETSTGMVNDLERLGEICARHAVRLCADCISAIGAVPVDLHDVYLASGTSGKALAAAPGLALVFANRGVELTRDDLPSYFDLALYRQADGVPYTISTNLVYALKAALAAYDKDAWARTVADAYRIRRALTDIGLTALLPTAQASPAVTTIALPDGVASGWVGERLAEMGYLVSYRSGYLLARNWVQVCLMGDYDAAALPDLVSALAACVLEARVESR